MALKKDKEGTVTGAKLNQSSRGKKGGLTGSERVIGKSINFPESSPEVALADSNARANLAERLNQGGGQIFGTVEAVTSTAGKIIQYASQVGEALQGTTNDHNPSTVTDGTLDTAGILASTDAEIDGSIGRLENAEALKRNLIIAQQRNFVGVAINNTKLKQDIATLDIEQSRLIGLLIDGQTTRVNNETKAVTFHRAVTKRDTELSHLEQDRELLTHQRIRTEGTQNQTELVREQEQLKVQRLREEVDRQRYEIQNIQHEKEKLKQEVAAKFLVGF